MASPTAFYAIQPSFTGGEVSKDVASRVDIEQYQSSLLLAENVFIKPYGGLEKRSGTLYCGNTKYSDKKSILVEFNFTTELCYMLEVGVQYIRVWREGQYLGVEIATPFSEDDLSNLRFAQSVDVLYICSGVHPVQILGRYSEKDWRLSPLQITASPYENINDDEQNFIAPNMTTGNITLTTTKDTFDTSMVGMWLKLQQEITGQAVSCTSGASGSIRVGHTWKITTHGTWSGTVTVQYSADNISWKQLRNYTSAEDYNATESGTVEEYSYLRLVLTINSGTCTADLSAYPYTHEGSVKITGILNAKQAAASVIEPLGSTAGTIDWNMGSWGSTNGYPCCATFFQDRLIFAANKSHPQRIWMSRSGDYNNFGIEKADGQVTDDSAITIDLVSRDLYKIMHLVPGQDLVILTEGNEWLISGSEVVTPSKVTPKVQGTRGSSPIEPQYIGNRIIYVQKRGSTVRDMGYSFDSDSYAGEELTLFAKHLVKNKKIIDITYQQEPNSVIYFVCDDGMIACITYIREQKVFAWSHLITDGKYESVLSTQEGNNDVVYVIVKREIKGQTKRYVEKFTVVPESPNAIDYIMTDAAKCYKFDVPTDEVTGLEHLEGKTLQCIADGYCFDKLTVDGGKVTLPAPCLKINIGLPVVMKVEQCNFEAQLRDGSMQGRMKSISAATLRLIDSRGGAVGTSFDLLDDIIYFDDTVDMGDTELFTGDKKVTLPVGGFMEDGRVCILHDLPYQFNLSAIIRVMSFGG